MLVVAIREHSRPRCSRPHIADGMSPPGPRNSSVPVVMQPTTHDRPAKDPKVDRSSRPLQEVGFRLSTWAMIIILLLLSPAQLVFLGWVTDAYRDTTASSEVSHRLHEVVFGVFFSLALVGAISQIATKRRNLAGMIQLAFSVLTLMVMVTVTVRLDFSLLLYLLPLLAMLVFHGPIQPWREGRAFHLWAAILTLVALPAFVAEISGHIARAHSSAQNHTTHWSVMAAFSGVLLLMGLVVTLGIRGYRLVAWSLASAAIIYGIASLAFPYDASSHRFAYAIALVLWGVGWAIGARFHKTSRTPTPRRRLVLWIGAALAGYLFLGIAAILPILDTPANVPHRPNPDQPELMATDVDRTTCLSCHATGAGGAPQPPQDHPLTQTCGSDQPCWGGRTDCAGCHSIDPALGGPTRRIEVASAADSLSGTLSLRNGGQPLSAGSIARLEAFGLRR